MPKDYKNLKTKPTAPIKKRFSNVLPFFMGLSIGLFVAVIVYFYEHNMTLKTNKPLLVTEPTTDKVIQDKDGSTAELPEPKFAFYKILPSKEVKISEWESVEEEEIAKNDKNNQAQGMFVLQVGSFKQYDAADEIKAKLALMGITANIQPVIINGQDARYRVRVGPYKNTKELQEAQNRLLTNHFDFMLLKLKMKKI